MQGLLWWAAASLEEFVGAALLPRGARRRADTGAAVARRQVMAIFGPGAVRTHLPST